MSYWREAVHMSWLYQEFFSSQPLQGASTYSPSGEKPYTRVSNAPRVFHEPIVARGHLRIQTGDSQFASRHNGQKFTDVGGQEIDTQTHFDGTSFNFRYCCERWYNWATGRRTAASRWLSEFTRTFLQRVHQVGDAFYNPPTKEQSITIFWVWLNVIHHRQHWETMCWWLTYVGSVLIFFMAENQDSKLLSKITGVNRCLNYLLPFSEI